MSRKQCLYALAIAILLPTSTVLAVPKPPLVASNYQADSMVHTYTSVHCTDCSPYYFNGSDSDPEIGHETWTDWNCTKTLSASISPLTECTMDDAHSFGAADFKSIRGSDATSFSIENSIRGLMSWTLNDHAEYINSIASYVDADSIDGGEFTFPNPGQYTTVGFTINFKITAENETYHAPRGVDEGGPSDIYLMFGSYDTEKPHDGWSYLQALWDDTEQVWTVSGYLEGTGDVDEEYEGYEGLPSSAFVFEVIRDIDETFEWQIIIGGEDGSVSCGSPGDEEAYEVIAGTLTGSISCDTIEFSY